MKKLLFGTILLTLAFVFPMPTMARVDVGISISLPPVIVFAAPPVMVVIPETNVYVVPDVDVDIFFYNGWWWRPWEGRWYRSRNYRSGWVYYQMVPSFYVSIPSGWRNDYRAHRWRGHQWNYQRIPQQQVQRNWNNWEKSRHWEKKNTWGVQGLKPQTRSQQPSQAVQPKSQAKPQSREAAKPQQSQPQSREVQPQHSQPQQREAPQQSQKNKPQYREEDKPQQLRPQSREVQQQHSQPQHQDAPQQSKSRQGKPERGEDEKQDRR
ncbi:MAG: hypothetical protein NTV58_07240 [Deltaproteobacteria bacterium]|nr:hypothetical protein [Deltaproteobacteria bacterium]